MRKKVISFRDSIKNYNIMLIIVVVFVCTIYVLINNRTNQKFDETYNSVNELNQFYAHAKQMNEDFQMYIYSPNDTLYTNYQKDYHLASTNIDKVIENLRGSDSKWRFHLLQNMIDDYMEKSDYVIEANNNQAQDANEQYQNLLYKYELISRTSSEYYDIVTADMQLQKQDVIDNERTMRLVTIFFIGYAIVWMIYFSLTTITAITSPIEKIMNNMNRIKRGEYDLTQISNINKEMNVLCLALEDLSKNIQKNIRYANEKANLERKVLQEQNANLKKDELLAQSELRVLQNQINPHFLFNTLNMIYKKAYSEGAVETSELMVRTSQLLRYGLDNTNKVSSLKYEIEAITNYNYIQEKRYGERIQFILEVEADIEDIQMPGMILQPLVENAVTHGLKDTTEDGEVIIEIVEQGSEVIISISDNGCGLPASQLENLMLNDFRMSDDDSVHLGLYNVTRRLRTFYGERVHIFVNSEEDCGFEIIIRIAKEGD